MKLLFINYEYPPLGGGAANATRYILREFSRIPDVEAHLVTSGMGEKYEKEHIGGSVYVHRIPIGKNPDNIHVQSIRDILVYSWKAWWYTSKLVKEAGKSSVRNTFRQGRDAGGFDSTIAFFGVPCGALALGLKWRYRIPYHVSLRGSDVPGYSEKFNRTYFFLKPLIRLIWRHARSVVPNSQGLAELAKKTAPKQAFEIIPNGVDMEEFRPFPEREQDGYARILTVSRLTPRKGIRFLIRAMETLRTVQGERLELWLVGDGEEKENLRVLAGELGVTDHVKFFGPVPHKELPKFYGLADVFCLPSLNEGMSNTVLEAIASGLPIVATVTGGMEELVRDGENGLFVRTGSPEDLAEKLNRILADEHLRRRMGEASRKRAEEMSWNRVANRFLDLGDQK